MSSSSFWAVCYKWLLLTRSVSTGLSSEPNVTTRWRLHTPATRPWVEVERQGRKIFKLNVWFQWKRKKMPRHVGNRLHILLAAQGAWQGRSLHWRDEGYWNGKGALRKDVSQIRRRDGLKCLQPEKGNLGKLSDDVLSLPSDRDHKQKNGNTEKKKDFKLKIRGDG